MLKQYKLLLYLVGLVCSFLWYTPVYSQGSEPVRESTVYVCSDQSLAIDLFKELGVQISPDNGYWVDKDGNLLPDNIFLTEGYTHGQYDFTFVVTSDAYCAPSGSRFLVTVELIENDLETHFTLNDAKCDVPNGFITINSVSGSGSGTYVYTLYAVNSETSEKTTVSQGQLPGDLATNPYILGSLHAEDKFTYILHVRDIYESNCGASYDTIKLAMDSSNDIQITTNRTNNNCIVALVTGGVEPYTYEWILMNGASVTDTIHSTTDTLCDGIGGRTYLLRVTDSLGCFKDHQVPLDVDKIGLIQDYFFCQDDNMELFTHTLIDKYTLEQLLFETIENPDTAAMFVDATVKAYATLTSDTEITVNLLDLLRNGVQDADSNTFTFYVDVTRADGMQYPRQRITITIFEAPELDLIVLNERPDGEYELTDMIQLQAVVRDEHGNSIEDEMLWYKYYLNGRLKGDTDKQVIGLNVLEFTGEVNDILKLEVGQQVQVPTASKDNVCVWDTSVLKTISVPFPNAFTPDGDGINDVFLGGDKFRGREFHLQIINRWGNLLYSGSEGWDGKYKGSLVAPGTYFYIVKLKAADGSSRTIKGSVTLILKQ